MRSTLLSIAVAMLVLSAVAAREARTGGGPASAGLPPSDSTATQRLNTTPRHGELVAVDVPGESVKLRTWISYPERKDNAGVVIVIHEIFGLLDWIRGVADQLAADGFIAVVPDLVTGLGPGGGGTESFASRDSVVQAVFHLSPEETAKRLDATRDWALKLPAGNGRYATMGFCWGGGVSFRYAASTPAPKGAIVFYGVSPDSATIQKIAAPVLGFYGGDDARVGATIAPAAAQMVALEKNYEVHSFEGAGHGFLRQQSGKDGANLKATQQAWPRAIEFLRKQLK